MTYDELLKQNRQLLIQNDALIKALAAANDLILCQLKTIHSLEQKLKVLDTDIGSPEETHPDPA